MDTKGFSQRVFQQVRVFSKTCSLLLLGGKQAVGSSKRGYLTDSNLDLADMLSSSLPLRLKKRWPMMGRRFSL